MEIQQLKDCCVMMLEPVSNPSVALVNETVNEVIEELHLDHNESVSEVIDELHLDHNESVFLAGGYDGISCLSSLDLYYPSHDVIKSLKPMSCARSYFSAAQLNNDLYVFGGGSDQDGSEYYDTGVSLDRLSNCFSYWNLNFCLLFFNHLSVKLSHTA